MVLIAGGRESETPTVFSTARLYDPSFAKACTSNAQCSTGFCANGVCCNSACNGGCGACNLPNLVGTCSPRPSATVCRAAAGVCDAAESCNGTVADLPDQHVPDRTDDLSAERRRV